MKPTFLLWPYSAAQQPVQCRLQALVGSIRCSFVGKLPVISDKDEGSLLSPSFCSWFLHHLRERKNLMRIFRQIVRFSHIDMAVMPMFLCVGLARSSYVAQIRNAHPYYIGVFRQSQAPTVLSLFRLMSHP